MDRRIIDAFAIVNFQVQRRREQYGHYTPLESIGAAYGELLREVEAAPEKNCSSCGGPRESGHAICIKCLTLPGPVLRASDNGGRSDG